MTFTLSITFRQWSLPLVLLTLLLPVLLGAQRMRFASLDAQVGSKSVTVIQEDAEGFIWIGTIDAGVYRYDGLSSLSYGYDFTDEHSLNSNVVFGIYVDRSDRLWVSTNEGLNRFDRGKNRFDRIVLVDEAGYPHPVPVRTLTETDSGEILVGTMYNGLYTIAPGDSIARPRETAWNADSSLVINQFVHTADKALFAATSMGLMYYDDSDRTLRPFVVPAPASSPRAARQKVAGTYVTEDLICINRDERDDLWLGTREEGLLRLRRRGARIRVDKFPVTDKRILSLAPGLEGDLLVGTENDGLLRVDTSGRLRERYLYNSFEDSSIGSNSIWSLHRDRNDRLWVGLYNKGISVYDRLRDKFGSYQRQPGNENTLQGESVTNITEDGRGRLWVTSDGGGLDIIDPVRDRVTRIGTDNFPGLTDNNLLSVLADRRGNIWVGSWGGSLFLLPPGERRFRHFTPENTGGDLPADKIMHLSEDNRGRIWISTFGGGVAYYDTNEERFYPCNGEDFRLLKLGSLDVRIIKATRDGNIWAGTTGGLYRIRPKDEGGFRVESMRDKISAGGQGHSSTDHILSLYEAFDGKLWIGTDGGGLFSYDSESERMERLSGEQFTETTIKAIVQDSDGDLWVSGQEGISHIRLSDGQVSTYGKEDGLLADGFNNNSVLRASDGRLYFGSYEGVNFFRPRNLRTNLEPPRVILSDLKLFSESVDYNTPGSPLTQDIGSTEQLTLTSRQSVFTLEFIGIGMTRPEKNTYAYRLNGFDDNWQNVGQNRSATYTNLPAGEYVFEVRAANNDGVWSEQPARLKISILPPWYFSTPALFVYAVLLLGFLLLLRHFDRQRYRERQLIVLEREKRWQEEELNEKKLQFFTNISHEFRTPLTLIINPLKDIIGEDRREPSQFSHDKLMIVYRNADKLSRLVDELMDFREMRSSKPEPHPEIFALAERLEEILKYFEEEGRRRSIELTIGGAREELIVRLDPSMLEKILFNLISNAFKVTADGGRISVEIGVDEAAGRYDITVTDTGIGLDPEDLELIFQRFHRVESMQQQYYSSTGIGLEVVKTLAEIQGGVVEVESVKGEGSTFRVIFPLEELTSSQEAPLLPAAPLPLPDQPGITTSGVARKVHTLLVVEDNSELRQYLRDVLRQHFIVLTARNGQQGYKLAIEKQPDVVLTDVVMPVMDGLEMCARIKSDVKTSHIPLLMLTARTQVKDRLKGIDSGADGYLAKPFDLQILIARLRQLIHSRQLLFEKYYGGITAKAVETTTTADTVFLSKLLGIVKQRIDDQQLSVESLSADLFLSRSHLYRKTKALTGMSVNQFIRRVRLERARELLEQQAGQVSEVAYQVGFTSPSYFAKCFREQYGCLPHEVGK